MPTDNHVDIWHVGRQRLIILESQMRETDDDICVGFVLQRICNPGSNAENVRVECHRPTLPGGLFRGVVWNRQAEDSHLDPAYGLHCCRLNPLSERRVILEMHVGRKQRERTLCTRGDCVRQNTVECVGSTFEFMISNGHCIEADGW